MTRKKFAYILIMIAVAAVSILGTWKYFSTQQSYSSFIAIGCSAAGYKQESSVGYLTLSYGDSQVQRKITVKVEDPDLQSSLSSEGIDDIIGVNLELVLSSETIQSLHISTERFNPFLYLGNETIDDHLTLLEIFRSEN